MGETDRQCGYLSAVGAGAHEGGHACPLAQQFPDQVGADQAVRAGDEGLHDAAPASTRAACERSRRISATKDGLGCSAGLEGPGPGK